MHAPPPPSAIQQTTFAFPKGGLCSHRPRYGSPAGTNKKPLPPPPAFLHARMRPSLPSPFPLPQSAALKDSTDDELWIRHIVSPKRLATESTVS